MSLGKGNKQGELMGAIKGARADRHSFKDIDDEFEIDPDVNAAGASKKGGKMIGFTSAKDNLR